MATCETESGTLFYQVDEPPARIDELAAPVDELAAPVDELAAGNGACQTVVFCHGVGTDGGVWAGWVPALADRFRIVRLDTRGFGRSTDAACVPWSLDRLADDIEAVARAAGARRYHLVGESLGGTVSLHLAARGTASLASLTVASTAYRGYQIGKVRGWRSDIETHGLAPWSERMMHQRFTEGALDRAAWEWFETVQLETDPTALLSVADLLMQTDLSAELARIEVPTLILGSDGSPYVTPVMVADLHSHIAGAELAVLPNSRHGIVFSHADECARLFLDFVSRRAS